MVEPMPDKPEPDNSQKLLLSEELNSIRKSLQINSLKDIGINKSLAKFGDAITNTIYTIAKTAVLGQFTQRKVNRTILSHALKNAEMKLYGKTRSDAHAMADTTEAFIGFVYCEDGWTIESMGSILIETLKKFDLNDSMMETQAAIEAFTVLLRKIKKYLVEKYQWEN
ncbi:MAG: hypothetical protein DRO88_07520 [Promethearchaeia archaeon]|nr:MAG: hypothetical protein DRO88_07520 [Candidatus Lokiarchaeia archaeon]